MREKVTISHRGARYEIGRGGNFFAIWAAGAAQSGSQPFEWWPDTREGWSGAWQRFTTIEAPGTIAAVSRSALLPVGNAAIAAALLAAGVVCGIAGLFPSYVAGASLAQQPAELVPHAIYLAAWSMSAVLILLGGDRLRAGALLGLGTSIVTFGLFFADAGQVIAGGAHLAGAGLVLGLVGWLACAAGSTMAFRLRPAGAPGQPKAAQIGPVAALILAGLGAAIAFAPSWDSFVLRTADGTTQSLTAGNAFANPGPVIFGNVAVMVAVVAVVAAAALWRPVRLGAALLAGAAVPLVAQAISALVGVGEGATPQQFGISSAEASRIGLTIDSGLTPVFWVYCAFVAALIAACAWMLAASRRNAAAPPQAVVMSGAVSPSPGVEDASGGVSPAAPAAPAAPDAPGATSP
ncbi:MAG TPA: hypothetical protein VGR98_10250 [Streptosporangiaceae bacterium]|nr:hypothetical protein [Streptosporangiaceae bacterium]